MTGLNPRLLTVALCVAVLGSAYAPTYAQSWNSGPIGPPGSTAFGADRRPVERNPGPIISEPDPQTAQQQGRQRVPATGALPSCERQLKSGNIGRCREDTPIIR